MNYPHNCFIQLKNKIRISSAKHRWGGDWLLFLLLATIVNKKSFRGRNPAYDPYLSPSYCYCMLIFYHITVPRRIRVHWYFHSQVLILCYQWRMVVDIMDPSLPHPYHPTPCLVASDSFPATWCRTSSCALAVWLSCAVDCRPTGGVTRLCRQRLRYQHPTVNHL